MYAKSSHHVGGDASVKGIETMLAVIATAMSELVCRYVPDRHPIAEGTYRSAGGDETLFVSSDRIRFQIRRGGTRSSERLDLTYEYTVQADGNIEPFPMRSVEIFTGVGRFNWHTDGESIRQDDPKGQLAPRFYKRESG
jgi:hypothetical protein